jgi:hypothetical protein
MRKKPRFAVLPSLLALALLDSQFALSHGALAIGVPDSVIRDGIALGYSWNAPNRSVAEADALNSCRTFDTASSDTRALCRVVTTYRHACLSIALDEQGGGGWGWAVRTSVFEAEGQALRACRSTLQKICVVAITQCDSIP